MHFSARAKGFGRLFSDAETAATVGGQLGAERSCRPNTSIVWTEDGETETVDNAVRRPRRHDDRSRPPRSHPERYVPFTEESNADASDLVSAFLWPVEKITDETCNRTLPLVDGRRRFDIALGFARFDSFATRDGSFSSPVAVCSMHYTPVAGTARSTDPTIPSSDGRRHRSLDRAGR